MTKDKTDYRIVWALVAINGTLCFLFLLVAAYANHCLLSRDDARRWRRRQEEEERLSIGEQISQDSSHNNNNNNTKTRVYDTSSILNSPPLSSTDEGSYFLSEEKAPISPIVALPGIDFPRDQWLISATPIASHSTTSTILNGANIIVNRNYENNLMNQREENLVNWFIFFDPKSVLFIIAFSFSLMQAITILTLTLTGLDHVDSPKSRKKQDIVALPQAMLLFLYFTVLCILLYRLGDTSWSLSSKKFRMILWGSIIILFLIMILALILVLTSIFPMALEFYGSLCHGILILCFLVTSVVLPRRIASYGESLAPIAAKVRRVTLTTAISLTVRLVILLPAVQSGFEAAGVFAPTIFYVCSIIPVAASLHLLHSPS